MMRVDLYKYIYFVGIGGIGMSALARYFNAKGRNVYGYDHHKTELCSQLEKEGISVHYIPSEYNIPQIIKSTSFNEILVVYTPAVSFENPELKFFKKKGCHIYKRAEVLGMISKQLFTIAVAGTHGKTTTSTMLAHILYSSGTELTAFLGGISKNYNSNLLLSKQGDLLIVEADEYDRSFLYLEPDIAIITSVEADHMDIYETKQSMENAYLKFSSQIKEKGLLLVEKSINISFPVPKAGNKLTYSANFEADCYANNIEIYNGKMKFDLFLVNIIEDARFVCKQKNIKLVLPGEHNVSNFVAAATISYYLGLKIEDIVSGIHTFNGIKRRFEVLINNKNLAFIDDYAHHPTEVISTINTTKDLFPGRNITVVFQPHLFSRTKDFANEFATSLSLADRLILLDIYPARESRISGVDSEMLLELCTNIDKETCTKDELLKILKEKELDVLLTLGAGDIGDLVAPIKHMLN